MFTLHQVKELLEMNYSNSAVVFLGRITSNTNKMSDSRDETLCQQSIDNIIDNIIDNVFKNRGNAKTRQRLLPNYDFHST